MKGQFEMSMMGELTFFLGLQIKQRKNEIFISQTKYLKELLKKYGMDEANRVETPMSSKTLLDVDEKGKPFLYLTASRLDIQFSVGMCSRFQSCPKESYDKKVKRIYWYLPNTVELGIWYPKGGNEYLIAYLDSDHSGYKTERKSTSG